MEINVDNLMFDNGSKILELHKVLLVKCVGLTAGWNMNCKGELITAAVVATSAVLSFHTLHFVNRSNVDFKRNWAALQKC